jgi:hypothetical protein
MTTLDPTRRERLQLELHKHQWRAAFPGSKELYSELTARYLEYAERDNRTLPAHYRARLLNIVVQIYESEFPAELPDAQQDRHIRKLANPIDTYQVFTLLFLKALIALIKAFPSDALLPIEPKPTMLTRLLPVYTEDKKGLRFEIQSAFDAASRSLQDSRTYCETLGIFDWNNMVPFGWHEFSDSEPRFHQEYFREREFYRSEPVDGDPEERRRWRRDYREFKEEQKREKEEFLRQQRSDKEYFESTDLYFWEARKKSYDKAHKDVHATPLPWQTTFFCTPLHAYVGSLVPNIYVPFELPFTRRYGGHYIIAPSGLGKTTLLTGMILDDIHRVFKNEASIVVMDPKGELTDVIKRLALFVGNDKLVLIEPEDKIAINPFDVDAGTIAHTVEAINFLFSSFAGQLTDLQTALLRPTIRALLTGFPDPTLDTLHQLLAGGLQLHKGKLTGPFAEFAENHSDSDIRSFFLNEFTNDSIYKETKGQIIRRLRSLKENEIMKHWFTAKKTRFNIAREVDSCKVIVINNSREVLTGEGAEFFGRYFITQLRVAGERRKTNDSKNVPTFLYIDECDQVIKTDHNIEDFIDKLRSKNIGVILAHQRLYHFDGNKPTLDALLNAPIRFASVDDDAEVLAKRFRVGDPSELRFPELGYFAAYVRQHKPEAMVLRVEKAKLNFMSNAQQAAIRAEMRRRYSNDPSSPGPAPRPDDDTLYWERTLRYFTAVRGGFHEEEVIVQYDRSTKPPKPVGKIIRIPIPRDTHLKKVYRVLVRNYGLFKPDGTRGAIIIKFNIPQGPKRDQPPAEGYNPGLGHIDDDDEIG